MQTQAIIFERDNALVFLDPERVAEIDRTLGSAGSDPALWAVTLTSSALGIAKPDPQAFRAVASALRLPLVAWVAVDDLAENVAAARSIGMQAFQIDRSLPADPAGPGQIASLLALTELMLPPLLRA